MKNQSIIIISMLVVAMIVGIFLIVNNQKEECTQNSDCGTNKYCSVGKCYSSVVCQRNFTCSNWGACINNKSIRTCTDLNGCPINQSLVPDLIKSCNPICSPIWQCTGWDICMSGNQIRTCTDLNGCNILTGKPITSQPCNQTICTENWNCGSWTTCSGGTKSRICTDNNGCGTTNNKPIVSESCIMPYQTNVVGGYDNFISGTWIKVDINNDGNLEQFFYSNQITAGICQGSTSYQINGLYVNTIYGDYGDLNVCNPDGAGYKRYRSW